MFLYRHINFEKPLARAMSEFKTHNIMKRIAHISSFTLLLCLLLACKPEPQPIDYGKEACAYCRMSIVDNRYAAQLVSDKGKAYSFDAIECMINYKHEHRDQLWYLELLSNFNRPGEMIPAAEATIIRSPQLPSPMGMYLTAVGSKEKALELQQQHKGELYRYQELVDNLDNLPAL